MFEGGYYHVPENNVPLLYAYIPVYWDKDTNLMPALTEIERELGAYVTDRIGLCLNDYHPVIEQGYQIRSKGILSVEASIVQGSVQFRLLDSTVFSTAATTYQIQDILVTRDVDLATPYSIASIILAGQILDETMVPIGLISRLAQEYAFTFETLHDENTVIISLIFPQKERELIYAFAHTYSPIEETRQPVETEPA